MSKYSVENNKVQFQIFPTMKKRSFHSIKKQGETHQFQEKWTIESNNLCNLNVIMKLVCSWQHCGNIIRVL